MKIIIDADNAENAKRIFDLWLRDHEIYPKKCVYSGKTDNFYANYNQTGYGYKLVACDTTNVVIVSLGAKDTDNDK